MVNLLLNEPGTPPNSSHPLLGGVGVWDYYLLKDFSQTNPFFLITPQLLQLTDYSDYSHALTLLSDHSTS